jgi:hypothetical protein
MTSSDTNSAAHYVHDNRQAHGDRAAGPAPARPQPRRTTAYFSTCEWPKEAAPDFARRFDELSMAPGAQARRVSQLQDVVSER